MNTHKTKTSSWLGRLIGGVATLALTGATAVGQVFPDPTANDWDCVISGARHGVAQIAFADDFTVLVNQIIVPKKSDKSIDPRTGQPNSSNTNTPATQVYGFVSVGGQWGYDVKGRIIGYFTEVGGTNPDAVTNTISFVGKATTGKRLSLVCSTPFGKVSYRGVPLALATNLNATDWYGTKTLNKQNFQEFFTLTDSGDPNSYAVTGQGGGYSYTNNGYCMVSVQRKIAFELPFDTDDVTNQIYRVTSGSFNPKKISMNTKGWEQPSGLLTNNVKFVGRLLPQVVLPP